MRARRNAQRHYETKQYKKGLKAADAVLKKHAEHGETLAMRGLILNCMERKAEAYEYVKRGLSKDIRSHVCWHVFGLVHRSDRDYKEAVKCYRNALRIEPDNLQILRDLSLLQVQLRDRPGYLETRHVLLRLKPAMRLNWIGIAVANHLLGRHRRALEVLTAYEKTLEGSSESESAYERSEMALYKLQLMQDGGMPSDALALLAAAEKDIVDKTAVREVRAELQLQLGNYAAAAGEYRRLLALNAEEHGYHAGLHAALLERPLPPPTLARRPGGSSPYGAPATRRPALDGLSEQERSLLLTAYAELRTAHPRASAPRRLPLALVSADGADGARRFDGMFSAYALPLLRKGVPSLFADIRPLYADAAKAGRIGALLEGWLAALLAGGALPADGGAADGAGGAACGEKGSGAEVPSTLMWVRFMLAQHYDAHGRHEEALGMVDAAIAHTPTLVELYVFKGAALDHAPHRQQRPSPRALTRPRAAAPRRRAGRVYKHAGDVVLAAHWVEHARSLDLADRYLNTKATRYLLRAGQLEQAAAVIAHFSKDGTDSESNLFSMQAMWWEAELGSALAKQGQLGRALKKLLAVEKHFVDIVEDQFDFHTYCLRKMTLRAYLQLLRLEVRRAAAPPARPRLRRARRARRSARSPSVSARPPPAAAQEHIWGHAFFERAAFGAIELFVQLADAATARAEADARALGGGEEGGDALGAAERKKAASKARKAAAKAAVDASRRETEEKEAAARAERESGAGKKKDKQTPKVRHRNNGQGAERARPARDRQPHAPRAAPHRAAAHRPPRAHRAGRRREARR